MLKWLHCSCCVLIISVSNSTVFGISYFYSRNLNALHFNRYGDLSLSVNYSNLNADLTAGFSFSRSLAACFQYSTLPKKSDGILKHENEILQSSKTQRAFTFGLGYFLNDSLSRSIRANVFFEYTFGNVLANALTLHSNIKKGEMLVQFKSVSLSSNILFDAKPVNRFLKLGYSARLNSVFFQYVRSQPSDYFKEDSLSLSVGKSNLVLDHGVLLRLIGKKLNINSQFGLSHRIFPLLSASPVNKFTATLTIGVTYMPNLFQRKSWRKPLKGQKSIKEISNNPTLRH